MPTGVNLNQYAGPGSHIRWHSDNEPFIGPQFSPELIVSLNVRDSVEFKVRRRASGEVPSSIRLDHGDILVVDGRAQSESEHCTASGLQGTLHTAGLRNTLRPVPLAGVVGCVLPTYVQGLAEPSSRRLGVGEKKWSSIWGVVLLLLILVSVLLVSTWIHIRRGASSQLSASIPAKRCTSPPVVVPVGSGDGVGDCQDAANLYQKRLFLFPLVSFWERKLCLFAGWNFFYFWILLDMLVGEWEPTPCYRDAYLVRTQSGILGKGWQNHCKTTVSPLYGRLFMVSKRTIFFFWEVVVWMLHIGRARHLGLGTRFFTPGQLPVSLSMSVGG